LNINTLKNGDDVRGLSCCYGYKLIFVQIISNPAQFLINITIACQSALDNFNRIFYMNFSLHINLDYHPILWANHVSAINHMTEHNVICIIQKSSVA
jgi:hypothetical protein